MLKFNFFTKRRLKKCIYQISSVVMAIVFCFSNSISVNADTSANVSENSKNVIPIAMATDNNYIMPAIVAMTSILENKNENTFIDFHVMLSGAVTDENIQKLKKVETVYKNCCFVDLINMKDKYSSAPSSKRFTTPTYYRLNLSTLLPKYDKVLYLDVDTIVTRDLLYLFNQNIENDYVGGVIDIGHLVWNNKRKYAKKLGIKDLSQYINAGMLLMNLKKLKENNLESKFNEYIPTLTKRKLPFNDQDVVNAICYGKIKILSPIYNALQHEIYDNKIINYASKHCYSTEELNDAITNPVIIHYAGGDKPWKSRPKCKLQATWDKYYKIAKEKIGLENIL